MQAHTRQTSAELTEFYRSGSLECAPHVDRKSSQRRHDAVEHLFGKIRPRTWMPYRCWMSTSIFPLNIIWFCRDHRKSRLIHSPRRWWNFRIDDKVRGRPSYRWQFSDTVYSNQFSYKSTWHRASSSIQNLIIQNLFLITFFIVMATKRCCSPIKSK